MEHGNLTVRAAASRLIIIARRWHWDSAHLEPWHTLKQIAAGIAVVFKGSRFTKQRNVKPLKLVYERLNKARRQGLMSLESDVENVWLR